MGEDLDTLTNDCICYYALQFEVNGCVFTAVRLLIVHTKCSFFLRHWLHYLLYISMLNYSYIELFALVELGLKLKSIATAAARGSVARQWPSIS